MFRRYQPFGALPATLSSAAAPDGNSPAAVVPYGDRPATLTTGWRSVSLQTRVTKSQASGVRLAGAFTSTDCAGESGRSRSRVPLVALPPSPASH